MKKLLFIFAVLFFAATGCGDGDVQRVTSVENGETGETQKENDSDLLSDDESGNEQVTGDSDSVTSDDSDPDGNTETLEDKDPVNDNDPTDEPKPDNDNDPANDNDPTDDPKPDNDSNPVNDTDPTDDPEPDDDNEPVEDNDPTDEPKPDNDNNPVNDTDPTDDPTDDTDSGCCPAGTSLQNGVCEYDNCGQYAYYMNFQSKNGQFVFKEDPATSCYADKNTAGEKVPCCCGKEIYKFKSGNVQATYDTLIYATSLNNGVVATTGEWTCPLPVQCE